MAQVHFRGVRYGVREQTMASVLQAWAGVGSLEAKDMVARTVAGERFSLHMEDPDAAYSLVTELVDLGVNAEVDESDY